MLQAKACSRHPVTSFPGTRRCPQAHSSHTVCPQGLRTVSHLPVPPEAWFWEGGCTLAAQSAETSSGIFIAHAVSGDGAASAFKQPITPGPSRQRAATGTGVRCGKNFPQKPLASATGNPCESCSGKISSEERGLAPSRAGGSRWNRHKGGRAAVSVRGGALKHQARLCRLCQVRMAPRA